MKEQLLVLSLLFFFVVLAMPPTADASRERILLHDLTRTRTLLRASLRRERALSSALKSCSLSPPSSASSTASSALPEGALAALEAAAMEETSAALESMAAGARLIVQEVKRRQVAPSPLASGDRDEEPDDVARRREATTEEPGTPVVSAELVSDLECRLRLESDRAEEEGVRADEEAAKVRKLVETIREAEAIRSRNGEGRLKAKDRLVLDLKSIKSKDFAETRAFPLKFRMSPAKVGIAK
jgi:hypothetical protein